MMRESCAGCAHDLGGGQCGMSVERECADGGHEAWTPRTVFGDAAEAARYHDEYMRGMSFHARQMGNVYMAKWEAR